MVQSEQMPTTGEFEEMQVHILHVHVHACIDTYMYNVYAYFFIQADLLFKKEEKEKSEATAKTLELGT